MTDSFYLFLLPRQHGQRVRNCTITT